MVFVTAILVVFSNPQSPLNGKADITTQGVFGPSGNFIPDKMTDLKNSFPNGAVSPGVIIPLEPNSKPSFVVIIKPNKNDSQTAFKPDPQAQPALGKNI